MGRVTEFIFNYIDVIAITLMFILIGALMTLSILLSNSDDYKKQHIQDLKATAHAIQTEIGDQ